MVKPYNDLPGGKKEQVSQMFDSIAPKYDFLNHFLSLGIDKLWRKRVVSMLRKKNPAKILDIATGTGDLAIATSKIDGAEITGIDISEKMLMIGQHKIQKLELSQRINLLPGDSEKINFPDNSFDAITAAFGVRNFEDLSAGLLEMYRVLKPKGTVVILEFSKPSVFPVKQLYFIYFKYLLPFSSTILSNSNKSKSELIIK